jgi:hypothetical protein
VILKAYSGRFLVPVPDDKNLVILKGEVFENLGLKVIS